MTPKYRFNLFSAFFLVIFLTASLAWGESESDAPGDKRWFVSAYYGIYTSKTFIRTLLIFPLETEEFHFLALGVGKDLYRWKDFSLEMEGIVAHHYGEHMRVSQKYEEFVITFNLRYQNLPWDKYLKTTLAVGDGLSYATEKVYHEESRNLLNYLMAEATFALPQYPDISFVYRLHHRSGMWGVLGTGGSNFYTLGLCYRF